MCICLEFSLLPIDNENPTITDIPSDITQNTDIGQPTATVVWIEPMGNDNSGSLTLTSSHSSDSSFPIGDTAVTYTAVDAAGNTGTAAFTVTIGGSATFLVFHLYDI